MDASYEDAIVLGQEWSTLLGDSSDDKDAESNSHGSNSGNTLHSDTPRDQIAEEYIASLTNDSGLHLVEEAQIRKAYRDGGEVGLFSLFITHKFKDTIRQWTNEQLVKQGRRATTPSEFDAYLGLELAMSICPLNDITEFWSERRFLGQPDFVDTMERSRFQAIRSSIKLHPDDADTGDEDSGNSTGDGVHGGAGGGADDGAGGGTAGDVHGGADGGVDDGAGGDAGGGLVTMAMTMRITTTSLDENSIRTKARTSAKSYIPSKPDKYAIRFYAVVGWESLYVHSIWDNGSGNATSTTPPDRYTATYPELRTLLRRTLALIDVAVEADSPSVLWIAMMGHQTRLFQFIEGRRLMVSDSFYTRHLLAKALLKFTDGEVGTLGTGRLNLVDKWNKVKLTEAAKRVEGMNRGSWELVAAVDAEVGWKRKEDEHKKAQKQLPKEQQTPYNASVVISPRAE